MMFDVVVGIVVSQHLVSMERILRRPGPCSLVVSVLEPCRINFPRLPDLLWELLGLYEKLGRSACERMERHEEDHADDA